jgi:hypothetical protein
LLQRKEENNQEPVSAIKYFCDDKDRNKFIVTKQINKKKASG